MQTNKQSPNAINISTKKVIQALTVHITSIRMSFPRINEVLANINNINCTYVGGGGPYVRIIVLMSVPIEKIINNIGLR